MTSRNEIIGRLALMVGSVAMTLLALEIGCRLWRGPDWLLHWPNLFLQERSRQVKLVRDGQSFYADDPVLGYIPRPGVSSSGISYGADGFRVAPGLPAKANDATPVLATGDSFTEGEEVGDGETWPAYLQAQIGRRVVNAGVSGYSLGQIVLRTEQLAAAIQPAVIVVSFIADDLRRGEFRRKWGKEGPYFELLDGTLALRNVPVQPATPTRHGLSFWEHAFGWSALLYAVVHRLGLREGWTTGDVRVLPEGAGEQLACPLMQRLAALSLPTLVVAQYGPEAWSDDKAFAAENRRLTKVVLQCAADASLATLDLFNVTEAAIRRQGYGTIYRIHHHTPDGNRLIAEAIADEIHRRRLLPRQTAP